MRKYEEVLLFHLETAASVDVDGLLWRNVFYAVIEYYRKRQQPRSVCVCVYSLTAALSRPLLTPNHSKGKGINTRRPMPQAAKLCTFIAHAEAFYVGLCTQMLRLHKMSITLDLPVAPIDGAVVASCGTSLGLGWGGCVCAGPSHIGPLSAIEPNKELCLRTVHRLLMSLGDLGMPVPHNLPLTRCVLERYKAQMCNDTEAAGIAATYYRKSVRLQPSDGAFCRHRIRIC
jgi:hypothetical protein